MQSVSRTTTVVEIRPFTERDYEGVVAVANAVFPDRPGTVEETNIWEKIPAAMEFAVKRGFREVLRAWESRLDVTAFDFGRFGPYVDHALAGGVTITTLAAERAKDPEHLCPPAGLDHVCEGFLG